MAFNFLRHKFICFRTEFVGGKSNVCTRCAAAAAADVPQVATADDVVLGNVLVASLHEPYKEVTFIICNLARGIPRVV